MNDIDDWVTQPCTLSVYVVQFYTIQLVGPWHNSTWSGSWEI